MHARVLMAVFALLFAPATLRAAGGETIETATAITALPFVDSGNTCAGANDYDAACPYPGSVSPDLVYACIPPVDMIVDIDLCESLYDTKVYVYASSPDSLVACNDDFWGCGHVDWESRIPELHLAGGVTYYVVVDGYGSACGDYALLVTGEPVPVPVVSETWGRIKRRSR